MNEWINVYDKLPDNEDDVLLVCETYGGFGKQHILLIGYLSNGLWNLYHGTDDVIRVTHWIPIPDLPKESDNAHYHPDKSVRFGLYPCRKEES